MPAEVTVQNDTPTGYGVMCDGPACAWYHKAGMTLRHATNSVLKHNREKHPEPATLNLSRAAQAVQEALDKDLHTFAAAIAVWEALTGLEGDAAEAFWQEVLTAREDVILHVAPF